jgi:protein-S-isoprenylcysteine O-methyltransferase Ste14
MFVLIRAVTYASLFIALLLVIVPREILRSTGLARPSEPGPLELAGAFVGGLGGMLALWCILTFAVLGKGTPAPFDPPRQLVVSGPYRYVRNPMYLGAGLALAGAALFYRSVTLLGYAAVFVVATHVFVVLYEEPTLARLFGESYVRYRSTVPRWLPRIGRRRAPLNAGNS